MSVTGISTSSYSPSIVTSVRHEINPRAPESDEELTPEEEKQVEELKERDAEVRRHEQAHKAAAGAYARGGAQFDYETGPDGKQYAVGGEVKIDTSPLPNDPAATIRKAEIIKRAALAPAEPSAQDRRVAAEADEMKAKAQKELVEQARMEGGAPAIEAARASAKAPAETPARGTLVDSYA